jgi:large subunit ribosomal protein L24
MAKKFKKNDQIIVLSGADKKRIGKILAILGQKVLVEGINLKTIHKKPTSSAPGEIIKKEKPIHISNISHVENGKAVKIKFVTDAGEGKAFARKYRVSKKSGKKIGQ